MLYDLRVALRTLAKRPGFTVVAVATLAIGIGAVTAVFSLAERVLLRPLAYADPDRLVILFDVQPSLDRAPMSYPEMLDWRGQDRVFSGVGSFFRTRLNLTGEGDPERVMATRVTSNLLGTLGLSPALGRGLRPEEEASGGPGVALLTDGAWRRRFAADPGVLGRAVTLGGEPYTVVGVLPPAAALGDPEPDFWLPLGLDEADSPRGLHYLSVVGRLRPGVELAAARTEAAAIAERLGEAAETDHRIHLAPLGAEVVAEARPLLALLAAAVGCVLLIACVNVANLLLARASGREREIAIRKSLGGGRRRLIRQLLTESAALGLAGGAAGLLLAWWAVGALTSSAALIDRLPRAAGAGIDLGVLAFTVGVSLVTSLVFGVVPALKTASYQPATALRSGGAERGATLRNRLAPSLVVIEVALSLALLASAGLLVRSLLAALDSDPGFRPHGVIALELSLPDARYPDGPSQGEFFRRLRDRIEQLPGVEATAEISHLPMSGSSTNGSFEIEGREWPEGDRPLTDKRLAGPGYFATLGIPVVRGREITERDRQGTSPVVLINQTMAQLYFPGEDPIGKRIDFSWHTDGFQEIVGVVGDVRHDGLDQAPRPEMYMAYAQNPEAGKALGRDVVVRVAGDPAALMPAVRAQVFAVDPDQPVGGLRTLDELVAGSLSGRRMAAGLLAALGLVALLLAAIGLYGVLAYLVRQRTHEIGVRMAIGASPGDVLRRVIGRGVALATAGALIGLVGGLAAARLLATQLYGVGATDPATFAAAIGVLLAASLVACTLPALSAARVDPVEALRAE